MPSLTPYPVAQARQQLEAYVLGTASQEWRARKHAADRAVASLARKPDGLDHTTPLEYWTTGALVPEYHAASRFRYFATMQAFYENDFGAIELWDAPFSLTLPIVTESVNGLVNFVGGSEMEVEGDLDDRELREAKKVLRKHTRYLGWGGNSALTAGLDDMDRPFVMARSPLTEFPAKRRRGVPRHRRPPADAQLVRPGDDHPRRGHGHGQHLRLLRPDHRREPGGLLASFEVTREEPLYFPQALYPGRWRFGVSPVGAMLSPLRMLFNRYSRFNDIFDRFGSPIFYIDKGNQNYSGDRQGIGDMAGMDDAELQERLTEQRGDAERVLEQEFDFYTGEGTPRIAQYDPQAQALIPVIQDLLKQTQNANFIVSAYFGEGNGEALRNGQTVGIQTEMTSPRDALSARRDRRHHERGLHRSQRAGRARPRDLHAQGRGRGHEPRRDDGGGHDERHRERRRRGRRWPARASRSAVAPTATTATAPSRLPPSSGSADAARSSTTPTREA